MRIKDIITQDITSWYFNKFSTFIWNVLGNQPHSQGFLLPALRSEKLDEKEN